MHSPGDSSSHIRRAALHLRAQHLLLLALTLPRLGGLRDSFAHSVPPAAAVVACAVPAGLDICVHTSFLVLLLGSRLRADEGKQGRLLGTQSGSH